MKPVRASRVTLLELGIDRLFTLCETLRYDAVQTRMAADLFRRFAKGWGALSPGLAPPWPSDITDDHTPFEFSLALDGGAPELRFLVEVQAASPSIAANWDAALALNHELRRELGVELDRFSSIEELFAPGVNCPRFGLWHAICLRPGQPPDFKVYLNPQAGGKANARAVTEAAMRRLGFDAVPSALPPLGPDDELCYLSLDLSSSPKARMKVYVAHHFATVKRIEQAVSFAEGYVPGRAADFVRAMAPAGGLLDARPVLTCLSFVCGSRAPTMATVHFPVRSYAPNDQVVQERVLDHIGRDSAATYRSALNAFARRPLAERTGMQTYVSERLDPERARLTVYLAPEAYDLRERRSTRPPPPTRNPSAIRSA